MLRAITGKEGEVFPHDPALRGFHIVYRLDQANHCPGCGRSHWLIGRFSAECAFCATALPLAETAMLGTGTHSRNRRFDSDWASAA